MFFTLFTACFVSKTPFELTTEEVLQKASHEIEFGPKIEAWLKSEKGFSCESEAGTCPKSLVLIDMEKSSYQNDQNPEYILYDAFIDRLTSDEYNVRVLERDIDTIGFIEKELTGQELPSSLQPEDNTEGDDLTPEQRRDQVGQVISEISRLLAPQDVLFFDEESCCGDGVGSEDYSPIIANEIGAEKSELLKWLVQQYISLFPDGEPKPIPKNVVDVETAEYLFAYRVYDIGSDIEPSKTSTTRRTRIRLHVRIVNVDTSEIEVADFIEYELEEVIKMFEQKEKEKREKKEREQKDIVPYSSLSFGFMPLTGYTVPLSNDEDTEETPENAGNVIGLNQIYFSGNTFTKRSFRYHLDAAYGSNDYYNQTSIMFGVDKVFAPQKAIKPFAGVGAGIDLQSYSLAVWAPSNSELSQMGLNVFYEGGLIYNYKLFAFEVGYMGSAYSQTLGGSGVVGQHTVKIGFHRNFCKVINLPIFDDGVPCETSEETQPTFLTE